ncbi:MAG: hypothetical protein KY461_00295 [Actinobacteria bacterium]|nr:hypothetical protein [Actinomycetota bacterium]
MTSDLETMLRTSLHERAHDVEATPELWRQVDRRVSRRRALPLFVWTAAGVAAVVTAAVVGPGLLDSVEDGLVIEPAQSPSAVESPGEAAPGPVAAAPLTHYVAVADGRLVLRGVDGSESVLWESIEGGARTLAVRPGSTPDRFTVAAVAGIEGMLDLVVVNVTPAETSVKQTSLGSDTEDAAAMPIPAWSPDGSTVATTMASERGPELVLVEVDGTTPDGSMPVQRLDLVGESEAARLRLQGCAVSAGTCDRLRLQDWAGGSEGERLAFTSEGLLLEAGIARTADGWQLDGALVETAPDDYVVDVATHPDGRRYRLLAGQGAGSGDAEDAGLGLFLADEPLAYPDLPTAEPSGVWMTAVDGGVFVGLGSDARQVNVGEGRATMVAVPGTSYAAWIPVAGDPGRTPAPATTPTEEAPRADGPLSASGVTPYAAIDEDGRVAVFAGDGGPGEVIIDEQLWAPEAGVRVLDVSVRPGSSFGEVAGVVLLSTAEGTELAWFRAAAGETSVRLLGELSDLGPGDRRAPVWSPDGRHIAWVEPDGERGWTLRTLGMTDGGPTDDDAGFGVDVAADVLHAAGWSWEDGASAVGGVTLLVHEPGRPPGEQAYRVPIERQGDGALAVTGPTDPVTGLPQSVADLGVRDGRPVVLHRGADGWVLRQDGGDVPVPVLAGLSTRDLDLDVLDEVSIVTNRLTGEAYVVDLAGGVAPLEADAATTYGFDPVR